VADTVEALVHAVQRAPTGAGCQPYNIGSADAVSVTELAGIVAGEMGVRPALAYAGGTPDGAGWKGDVKVMGLSIARLSALGWKPRHKSEQAIRLAARALLGSPP
jgi:UDP-glucose 4-epimerase